MLKVNYKGTRTTSQNNFTDIQLSSDDTIADFKQVNNGWLITVSGFKLGLESYYL